MDIFVEPTPSGTLLPFMVQTTGAVGDLKSRIQSSEGIPPDQQVLSFHGKHLDNGQRTLSDYGISHQSTLSLESGESLADKAVPPEVGERDAGAKPKHSGTSATLSGQV
jgi:hypothetical protein